MDERVDYYLERSIVTASPELSLNNLYLNEFVNLNTFTWITKLNLCSNRLQEIKKDYFPPHLETLELQRNKIKNIFSCNIPDSITELDLSTNDIENFDGATLININTLYLSNNKTKKFIFPPNIVILNISDNEIEELENFPESLRQLDCTNNKLYSISGINSGLEKIDFSFNVELREFPMFPPDSIATFIRGKHTKVDVITFLPYALQKLDMAHSILIKIQCPLPVGLRTLNLSHNILTELPDFPFDIVNINVSNNILDNIGTIPESVTELDLSHNKLTEISEELKTRSNLMLEYHHNCIPDDDILDNMSEWWSSPRYRHKRRRAYGSSDDDYDEYNRESIDRMPHAYDSIYKHNYYSYGRWGNQHTSYSSPYTSSYTSSNTPSYVSLKSNSKMNTTNPNYVSYGNKRKIIL